MNKDCSYAEVLFAIVFSFCALSLVTFSISPVFFAFEIFFWLDMRRKFLTCFCGCRWLQTYYLKVQNLGIIQRELRMICAKSNWIQFRFVVNFVNF